MVRVSWNYTKEIEDALKSLKEELKTWNVKVFGNIELRKKRLYVRLCGLQKFLDQRSNKGLEALNNKIRQELKHVLHQEKVM